MTIIRSLNSFDKGFFGKTMSEWAEFHKTIAKNSRPSELKMSSIDDFNNYFYKKMPVNIGGKNLDNDVFIKEEPADISSQIQDIFS